MALPSIRAKRPVRQLVLLSFALLCAASSPALPFYLGDNAKLQKPSQSDIAGVWSDACPCKIPCLCWRSKPKVLRCVNVQVFHIDHGFYDGINLAGATFVLVSSADDNLSAPTPKILYVDHEYDSPTAARKLIQLFVSVFHLRPEEGVRFTKISASLDKSRQTVSIPGV